MNIVRNPNLKKFFALLILLLSGSGSLLLALNEEEQETTEIANVPLQVETVAVYKGKYRLRIPAWGYVEPMETIALRPEVPGKIIHVPSNIIQGAKVRKGELLFQIDKREYVNRLAQANALAIQAQQELILEKGQQTIARKEWQLLQDSKWQGMADSSLALRQPQLKKGEAAVQFAAAQKSQAALNVERTEVKSPCNGVILDEDVATGKVVDIDHSGITIGCTSHYLVSVWYPNNYSLSSDSNSPVYLRIGQKRYEGQLKSKVTHLHSKTRHKLAIVQFSGEGVFLNSYATLELPGPSFENVVVLERDLVRPGDSVWILKKDNTLEVRNVTILAKDADNIVIGDGLSEQDQIIISHIANPLEGMDLRTTEQGFVHKVND